MELTGADWEQTPKLALKPGLVAIIVARGSGKTALADAIAAGCDATDGRLSNASFIGRAREHLDGAGVRLTWETGDPSVRPLLDDAFDPSLYPRARYLSQKFVEGLCSADGLKDELLSEIERVIFEAHSTLERDGAADFASCWSFEQRCCATTAAATKTSSRPYPIRSGSNARSKAR